MKLFEIILLICLIVCAVSVAFTKDLLTSIVIFMSYSLIMCIIWILLQSPDLAITEAAVGAGVTSILFFITLKKIRAIRKDNYENSLWLKFKKWIDGETDLLADGMEIRVPEEDSKVLTQAAQSAQAELPGDDPGKAARMRKKEERGLLLFHRFYQVMSVLLCLTIIFVLLWTIAYLPVFGNAGNPDNNEVSARYIEKGVEETGALNYVTGMILDYRAFDTFGESCVLFIASCCVLALLRIDAVSRDAQTRKRLDEANDRLFEPKNDIILQKCACVLVPFIMIFGIYIILNGHLSPGGGFSGGAVLGSGLILYLNAFGFEKTERFFTEKVYRRITLCALTFYCVAKSYSFFTGANHLGSGIPLGNPGVILSSGLILPLNICVGLVVACTMYAFYTLFRKGGM